MKEIPNCLFISPNESSFSRNERNQTRSPMSHHVNCTRSLPLSRIVERRSDVESSIFLKISLILDPWCTFFLFPFLVEKLADNTATQRNPIAAPPNITQQPLFPFFPSIPVAITPITYPLLPFDFPASCVYPRIHEAVGEPVGKGLKVDEPKLFTWTDLARTNTDPLVHSAYVYASSDGCRNG